MVVEAARADLEILPAFAQNSCVSARPVLDRLDHRLLGLLQADCGRTLEALGEVVGLSPSAVQRRIARYRAEGFWTDDTLATVFDERLQANAGKRAVFRSDESTESTDSDAFQRPGRFSTPTIVPSPGRERVFRPFEGFIRMPPFAPATRTPVNTNRS